MDSLLTAAARALAAGDPLAALKRVALREDPPALALRGIAMAQLGELARARALLRRAGRGFRAHEELARARCQVAEAEVALAQREISASAPDLPAAIAALQARGDSTNASHARLLIARRLLLLGRLGAAAEALAPLETTGLPPTLRAIAGLCRAELAWRSLRITEARQALAEARLAAQAAQVPALLAEIEEAHAALARPAARCEGRALSLDEAAALLDREDTLVLDACRHGLALGRAHWLPLARRPILFALARELATAWPGDASREALIAEVFRTREGDETHRARLRVEIGRLRALVAPLAAIEATPRGFALRPHEGRRLALLQPLIDGEQAALLALLADGAAWSTSALALALDASQRTVQRALAELEAAGRVRAVGKARAQRWLAPPLVDITTILLLPVALAIA